MKKTISIPFLINGEPMQIALEYAITQQNDLHIISCFVNGKHDKHRVQLHKFELRTQCEDGYYTALFDEDSFSRSPVTLDFMDKAYTEIMQREKMAIAVAAS
ncbi:MAG: hypothetical protein JNL72_07515 [Flavipsychrobacter sp.]|nr:hypothetical protein [Flavipsychrobacter sp.]